MNYKYHEIMEHVINEIAKGTYKTKLPSIRGMAIRFSCSNSTVIKAYSELEEDGLIYSAPKSGYFINHNRKEKNREFDFYSGITQSALLPFEGLERAYDEALKANAIGLQNYGYSRGNHLLREHLAQEIGQGIDRDNILMMMGTQQFLTTLIAISRKHKLGILAESPTYNLMVGAMRVFDVPQQTVQRSLEGLDLDDLEEKAKHGDFKFFYTMSQLHNPLGTSLKEEEMDRLLKLADAHDFYIIDDDYAYELRDPGPSLYQRNPQRVIRIRSFSKTISASLRLSAVYLPDALKKDFHDANSFLNTGASALSQEVLLRFLSSDTYDKHRRHLRERLEEKCTSLRYALKDAPFPVHIPSRGLYAYMALPEGFRAKDLLENLDGKDMRFRSDREFSFEKEIRGLRLSLSRVDKKSIETGIEILLEEIRRVNLTIPEPKEIYI